MESSLDYPEDNTPGLSCGWAGVTGTSFWRCTFGKTFSVGKAEWKHTASKRIPKALNYLFTDAFIIDEAPVGFPLPQTPSLPISAWWAVVGNMLPLQSISHTSSGPLLQREQMYLCFSEACEGPPDRQPRAVSISPFCLPWGIG